jgi:hypothetical protein
LREGHFLPNLPRLICHVCLGVLFSRVLRQILLDMRGTKMNNLEYGSGPTSNDLLHRLIAKQSPPELNYQIVAQSADDVQNIENAPAVSMAPYLLKSGQVRLLTAISVYSLRGESREQVRLLYMNAVAIQVWEEMGKTPKIIGTQFRPPHTALLAFGVPFSK